MKTAAVSLGAFALNLALITIGVLAIGAALWILVPAILPVHFTFVNGVALASLLFVLRGIFK